MIRGSEGSLMLQKRSLSLNVAEGQPAAAEEQQALVGLPMTMGAMMSRFGRRRLWRELDVSSLLMLVQKHHLI